MKKAVYASIIALSLVFTASAYSEQGMYVSGGIGLSLVDDVDLNDRAFPRADTQVGFDSGVSYQGALGYRMDNLRFEGEISYQTNDMDTIESYGRDYGASGDVTALAFLANAYYDFPNSTVFTPFVTAGLGVAEVEVDDFRIPGTSSRIYSDDDTVFAWQVGAGVSYAVNEMFDVELKYRYFMTDDLNFSDNIEVDGPNSHNISLGLRYYF